MKGIDTLPLNHGEWFTLEAFEMWLRAVEIFLLLGLFFLAYCLIKTLTQEEGEEDA